jgi:hypothetical protein
MNLGRWWCSRRHDHRRVTAGGKLTSLFCDQCERSFPVRLSSLKLETRPTTIVRVNIRMKDRGE